MRKDLAVVRREGQVKRRISLELLVENVLEVDLTRFLVVSYFLIIGRNKPFSVKSYYMCFQGCGDTKVTDFPELI